MTICKECARAGFDCPVWPQKTLACVEFRTMGKKSRTKGAAGERELASLIEAHLGVKLHRNLDQTRDGGYDLKGFDGLAIEVKRYAAASNYDKELWWKQAVEQAESRWPVLAYRLDRQQWTFVVALSHVIGDGSGTSTTVEMGINAFAQWVRECVIDPGIACGDCFTNNGDFYCKCEVA